MRLVNLSSCLSRSMCSSSWARIELLCILHGTFAAWFKAPMGRHATNAEVAGRV